MNIVRRCGPHPAAPIITMPSRPNRFASCNVHFARDNQPFPVTLPQ